MKSFYSKVPRSTLIRVYEAYKLDFELFDYDFNQVLKLAGYEPLPTIQAQYDKRILNKIEKDLTKQGESTCIRDPEYIFLRILTD